MNVKLSELELRVISLLDDSLTMGELAERASVTPGYISNLKKRNNEERESDKQSARCDAQNHPP